MKKCFWGIIPMVMLVTMCATGAKPAASSGGMMTLDQAIAEAAARIDERLAAKTKIASLNFNSPHDKFSGYVLDELTANIVDSGKLTVVDRKEVDLIRGEFAFQFSGEVGDDSMQQLGRMLGAQSIISGSLTDMGGFYRIVIRVLNVQTASVEVQYRANIVNDAVMAALLTGGKTAVVGTPQRTQAAQSSAASTAPAASAYNIGDKGPAGGIIFFDKGSHSDGWRYLEAASADVAGTAEWGAGEKNIGGTNTGRGSGKRNTQIIADYLRDTGETGRAAQIAQEFRQGGYDDWFLPSKDELNLMYENIKQKGLGRFRNENYWSSSEGRNDYTVKSAWCQNFSDGVQDATYSRKSYAYLVRPIRQF